MLDGSCSNFDDSWVNDRDWDDYSYKVEMIPAHSIVAGGELHIDNTEKKEQLVRIRLWDSEKKTIIDCGVSKSPP